MKRVKYIGQAPGVTYYVGKMLPGEVREVPDEIADMLLRGMFELVEGEFYLPMKIEIKEKRDCIRCPKESE